MDNLIIKNLEKFVFRVHINELIHHVVDSTNTIWGKRKTGSLLG